MKTDPIIYLVDDDPSVLKSIVRLCSSAGFEVRAHACAQSFHDDFDPEATGCVILDRNLPEVDGHAVQKVISSMGAYIPVIFLTGKGDIASSVRAIKDGAVDYLTKPVDPQLLLETVGRAIELNQKESIERSKSGDTSIRLDSLTSREREVLDAVVAGRLNKQIAYDLDIAEKTVKVHRARVMHKMGAKTLAELVAMIVRHNEMKDVRG